MRAVSVADMARSDELRREEEDGPHPGDWMVRKKGRKGGRVLS